MTSTPRWADDKLGRDKFGDFLYKFLCARHNADHSHNSICCALDGDWGSGKTFFVDYWITDTINKQHIAIKYDAWKNDHQNDALMNFIAHINKEISPVVKLLPIASRARGHITTAVRKTMKKAGVAALPLAFSIAKNVGKKYIGAEGIEDIDKILSKSTELVSEKDIDKFLDATFKSHETKSASITKVKEALEELAVKIETLHNLNAPIFVVIDELDRCRPDYAISLLEGIKHILSARGIIFIISTNITQLSESVKALYGNNFDGRRYLRRFFDYEFELPDASALPLIEHLASNSVLSDPRRFLSGLCSGIATTNIEATVPQAIHEVTDAFSIDLRSIRQIISRMEAFAAVLNENERINAFYLCALCCLDFNGDRKIKEVIQDETTKINNILSPSRSHRNFLHTYADSHGYRQSENRTIIEIIQIYINNSKKSQESIRGAAQHATIYDQYSFNLRLDGHLDNCIAKYHHQLKRMPQVQSNP